MLVVNFGVISVKLTHAAPLWELTSLKLLADSLHFFREGEALWTGFQKCSSSRCVPRSCRDLITHQALGASYLLLKYDCVWEAMTDCANALDHEIDCLFYGLPRPRSEPQSNRYSSRRLWQALSGRGLHFYTSQAEQHEHREAFNWMWEMGGSAKTGG